MWALNPTYKKMAKAIKVKEELQEELQNEIPYVLTDKQGVLNSKKHVLGLLSYPSPMELFSPLLESLKGGELVTIEGEGTVKNANQDGTENVSYSRVHFFIDYPIDEEITYRVGVMVALDKKGKIKVYHGANVQACLNQCILYADGLQELSLVDGIPTDLYLRHISTIEFKIDASKKMIALLKSINLTSEQVKTFLGFILYHTIKEDTINGTSSILHATKLLGTKSSKYMCEDGINAWQLYNALTEYYGKGLFFDIPNKVKTTFDFVKKLVISNNQYNLPFS